MAESPFAHYGDFFKVEYRVNGVWNKILHQYFKPGFGDKDYVVCAETYPIPTNTKGLMMDLTVNKLLHKGGHMTIDFAYLCYEGKGRNGDTWAELETQLLDWFGKIEDHDEGGVIFRSWAIGTRGEKTRFYIYDTEFKLEYKLVTQEIKKAGGEWQLVDSNNPEREYDITKGDHWSQIDGVMTWLASKKP